MDETKAKKLNDSYRDYATVQQLTKETDRLAKDIEHIKNSRSFKLSKLTRPFSYLHAFFRILFKSRSIYKENIQLKKELLKKDYLIEQQDKQLDFIDRVITTLDPTDPEAEQALVKLITEEGLILDFIDQMIDKNRINADQIKRIIDLLTRSLRHIEDESLEKNLYQKVAQLYRKAQFPEYLIRIADQKAVSLSELDSFSDHLFNRYRMRQAGLILPESLLDDKRIAYQFIDQLEINRPEQTDETYTVETVPKVSKKVIKPTDSDGGRGVYLVKSETDIYDIKREQNLTSWQELIQHMAEDLDKKSVQKDEWYMETLLQLNDEEPARDLKFYSFYGEIALILEIKRETKTVYCWWDKHGNQITTGKYESESFVGSGISQKEIEKVTELSKQIPTPFMRIDFLRTKKGLVFGEFTPKPGNFDHFNQATDTWLGGLYIEAEARLNSDLIDGKAFTEYKNILNYSRSQ